MNREFFFVNEGSYNGSKLEMEIETIKKLLPYIEYIESFSAFVANNDICDIRNQTFMTNTNKIRDAVDEGLYCTTKYYVFGRN